MSFSTRDSKISNLSNLPMPSSWLLGAARKPSTSVRSSKISLVNRRRSHPSSTTLATSGFRSTASATTRTGTETFTSSSNTATLSYTGTSSYTAVLHPFILLTWRPPTATITLSTFLATNTNTWSNVNYTHTIHTWHVSSISTSNLQYLTPYKPSVSNELIQLSIFLQVGVHSFHNATIFLIEGTQKKSRIKEKSVVLRNPDSKRGYGDACASLFFFFFGLLALAQRSALRPGNICLLSKKKKHVTKKK